MMLLEALKKKQMIGRLPIRDTEKYRGIPSLAFPAIVFLDGYITRDMRVFEWGAGGSTVFLGRRAAEVYSVEHDQEYADIINGAIRYHELKNTHLLHIPPEEGDRDGYRSSHVDWKEHHFEKYVKAIDDTLGYFDIVLVDGRARAACLRHALPKLKTTALLILDDSRRPRYQKAVSEIQLPYFDVIGQVPYHDIGTVAALRIWGKGLQNVRPINLHDS